MSNLRVYSMMILTALFWSGAFITGKFAVREFPPFALTFFRFLFALPFIFAILYYRRQERWLPKRDEWLPLLLLGFAGTFLYHSLFFACLQYTTAINSSLIGSTNPMVTALLAAIFLGDKINRIRLAGFLLSFFGVFLVITGGDWQVIQHLSINTGDILMFGAVWSWAGYSILSRKVMQRYDLSPLMITAYTFLVCTIVAIPFVIWEQPMTYLPDTTLGGWLAVGYMAVFASVIGYLFQLIAIQEIGASRSAIFINLVPVFTIGQAWYFLHEPVTVVKIASAIIIISGVYLAVRPADVNRDQRQAPHHHLE